MPRSRNGAIVIEQESPWSQFLGGFGQGVSRGVQQFEKDAAETKALTSEFLYNVGIGKIAPEALAGADMQAFLEQTGLMKNPQIQAAVDRGKKAMPGASAPPSIPAQIPTSDQASAGIGGGAVNIPQPEPEAPPQSKVNEYLQNKADTRTLALNEAERKVTLANSLVLQQRAEDIRQARKRSLPEQLKLQSDLVKAAGVDKSNVSYTINTEGEVSVSIRPPDVERLLNRQDKIATAYTRFEEQAATYKEKQTMHAYRLRSMLENDKITPQDLALAAGEADSKWYMAALAAIGGTKDTEQKVSVTVDQVNGVLNLINQNIQTYNRAIQAEGDRAQADQDTITSRFIPKLAFEDVSGGLTAEEYKKRKSPEDPGKLISDVRGDYRGSGISSPRPAAGQAQSDTEKVTRVYEGLKQTVMAAMKDNPNVSGPDIKNAVIGNKEQIMAEYGLNEKLFSLLMAMSDKVLG